MNENILPIATDKQTELITDIIKTHLEKTSEFVYFLLGMTTVSIGYAITATEKIEFSHWMLLWGASIAAMSYSAHCGINNINQIGKMRLIAIKLFKEIYQDNNQTNISAHTDMMIKTDDDSDRSLISQQKYLYIGFGLFFLWHLSNIFTK